MPVCELKQAHLTKLLAQAGHGDSEAFRQLYKAASRPLMRHAQRIVRSREVAEEVLQESFIAIWRDAAQFDRARSAPLTWMTTVVRNKAVDSLRANLARNLYMAEGTDGEAFEQARGTEIDPCESVEREQQRRQVSHGLTSLNAQHRKAIELCYFKELSHAEVASEMTLPLGTVKTWIRRGCQQLRREMEQQPA